ncbi:uncharacterized protein RAG0_05117 [Rhynchosporium agropyri]|uniref:Uncharacterized protein n=1 Tax=Rhynchosporium agropyri TaxID=914238 RepID=A0A1E1KBR1_9HELO|nr:uncharacterized protein RAG0_05117 [Rhynchosporium agropyri]
MVCQKQMSGPRIFSHHNPQDALGSSTNGTGEGRSTGLPRGTISGLGTSNTRTETGSPVIHRNASTLPIQTPSSTPFRLPSRSANPTEVHRWIEAMKTPSNQASGSDASKESGYGLRNADFTELRRCPERNFRKRTAATIAKKIIQAKLEASPSRSHTCE